MARYKFTGVPAQGIELRHFGKKDENGVLRAPPISSVVIKDGVNDIDETWMNEWRDQHADHPMINRMERISDDDADGDGVADMRPAAMRESERDYAQESYSGEGVEREEGADDGADHEEALNARAQEAYGKDWADLSEEERAELGEASEAEVDGEDEDNGDKPRKVSRRKRL